MKNPETDGLSRRNFLKLAGAVVAGVATGGIGKVVMDRRIADIRYQETHETDPQLHIDFEKNNEQLTFEELASLFSRLGNVYTMLDLEHWRPHMTDSFVADFQKEVAYQLLAEGISTDITLPEMKDNEPRTKLQINHELGSTDCARVIYENIRFKNQASDLYDSPFRPAELVHETVHLDAQGDAVCEHRDKYELKDIEATAQMVTFEVLASMVNRQNRSGGDLPLKAFVFEMFMIVDGAFFLRAALDRRLTEYENIRKETLTSAYEQAREDSFHREYFRDPFTIQDILEDYYLYPLEKMIAAHRSSNDIVKDVALPPRYSYFSYGSSETYPATLELDDWASLMDHLDDIVDQVAEESHSS